MAQFIVYNTTGKEVEKVEVPAIFAEPVNQKLIHRYVIWVQSMLRHTVAHTKTRGEIRGGGKKPWKQKGTGRARVGSIRAPHWRGGGTIFGPRSSQTWEVRMPRGERRKAFFSALSAKATTDNVILLDEWTVASPKTKEVVAVLKALPIKETESILHVDSDYSDALFKSTANLSQIDSRTITDMNVLDVLNHDKLLMTKETLSNLQKHFIQTV